MVLLQLWVGGKLGVPFELQLVPQGTSHVASGKSSPLWSCVGECRSAFDSLQGNRASSHVGGRVYLVLFLKLQWKAWVHPKLPRGPQGIYHIA